MHKQETFRISLSFRLLP